MIACATPTLPLGLGDGLFGEPVSALVMLTDTYVTSPTGGGSRRVSGATYARRPSSVVRDEDEQSAANNTNIPLVGW